MSGDTFKVDWLGSHQDGQPQSKGSTISKSKLPGSSWHSLGVSAQLSRALHLRGFKTPTPIQRSAIPAALSSPPRDIVGMARTGSGKTLAYVVPLLHHLGGARQHNGAIRALILCPSRELAVQVLKTGKDLSRGLANGPDALRWALVMGGESLDNQFETLSASPDIVIATPGRFLHLVVEMNLDLRRVETVIYDEADRLFEMGFELQLREILHRLPTSRHSLLFSATLPSSLAEFAKAGLNNPEFIRLDTEHRISPDLTMSFFPVKPNEKDAALLVLLRDAIKVPVKVRATEASPKAIIFASTKHHVEYLSVLLQAAGYRVSFIYGSLDQVARQQQLREFRQGQTELLVVTDVAARGLDIPAIGNVINFDFPSGVRVFVHRVGRTARAGQQGSAWSLVTRDEMPYFFDLETFLERPLLLDSNVVGTMPQDQIESAVEYIHQSLDVAEPQLPSLREVKKRGQGMFERSRSKATRDAYKKVKAMGSNWASRHPGNHPVFVQEGSAQAEDEDARRGLLAAVQAYSPHETIFELGSRGQQATAILMNKRRRTISQHRVRAMAREEAQEDSGEEGPKAPSTTQPSTLSTLSSAKKSYRDPTFFLPHENVMTNREKGYSLTDGASFVEQARSAVLDLNADEGDSQRVQKASQMKWDRKRKRFVKGDPSVDSNQKLIRGESGALLPATFKSGRYDVWKKQKSRPGMGQTELSTAQGILNERREKEKRKAKNARPARKRQ